VSAAGSVAEAASVWLHTVGERGWVVLTRDQKLRYLPLEIAARRAGKAGVFVFAAGNLWGIEIAAVFLKALRPICKSLIRSRDRSWLASHNRGM
jgi:hypothetical protein